MAVEEVAVLPAYRHRPPMTVGVGQFTRAPLLRSEVAHSAARVDAGLTEKSLIPGAGRDFGWRRRRG